MKKSKTPASPESQEAISAKCWPCNRETTQRWAIDKDYLVCPQCGKLFSVADAVRFNKK